MYLSVGFQDISITAKQVTNILVTSDLRSTKDK